MAATGWISLHKNMENSAQTKQAKCK